MFFSTSKEVEELENEQTRKIERIACNGGGVKGVVYPGCYEAMLRAGLIDSILMYSGASIGAISAALMAVGTDPETFRQTMRHTNLKNLLGERVGSIIKQNPQGICFLTRDGKPFEAFIRDNLKLSVQTALSELNALQLFEEDSEESYQIQKILAKDTTFTFKDLDFLHRLFPKQFKKLVIPAIKFPNGELQIFSAELTPEVEIALACRASASIPVALQPVEIEIDGKKQLFSDVGVLDNVPTDYFDYDEEGARLPNQKPHQTFVFVFSGSPRRNKQIFQALYGERWDEVQSDPKLTPKLYSGSWKETFKINLFLKKLSGLRLPYEYSEQEEKSLQKIRSIYPLRSIELHVGPVSILDFESATRFERELDAFGYLDTMDHIILHELYDDKCDPVSHFTKISHYFEFVYKAVLSVAGKRLQDDLLLKEIKELRTELESLNKSSIVIAREIYQFIKDKAQKKFESIEAFALSRAVEFHLGHLTKEQLYDEISKRSYKENCYFNIYVPPHSHRFFTPTPLKKSLQKQPALGLGLIEKIKMPIEIIAELTQQVELFDKAFFPLKEETNICSQ